VTEKQRQCRCGAIYHRTEAMAASREIDSFECTACGATLEKWDTAWVPTYRRIADTAIESGEQADTRAQSGDRNAIPPRRS
jgi:hypothetical protein